MLTTMQPRILYWSHRCSRTLCTASPSSRILEQGILPVEIPLFPAAYLDRQEERTAGLGRYPVRYQARSGRPPDQFEGQRVQAVATTEHGYCEADIDRGGNQLFNK